MKRRVLVSILVLFGVLGMGISVAVSFQRQASSNLRELVRLHQIEGRRQELEIVLQRAQQDLLVSDTEFANDLDSLIDNVRQVDRAIEICAGCHHGPDEQRFLDYTTEAIEEYKWHWSRFVTFAGDSEFRRELQLDTSRIGDELLEMVKQMRHKTMGHLSSTHQEVLQGADRAWRALTVTLVTTGLVGLLLALVMSRRATGALGNLVDATHRIAEGKLGTTVENRESGEIGELLAAFNRMSSALHEEDQRGRRRERELRQTRDIALMTLARLAESRDTETGRHLERIAAYSLRLAEELRTGAYVDQIDDSFLELIHKSSPLHDIGKVGIRDAILLKDSPLTERELEVMKTHAQIGGDTLRSVVDQFEAHEFLRMAMDIAYSHHERWDGTGYPAGLSGEAIPLPARIVALADAYDAITSARPYERAFSHDEAVRRIRKDSGTHFDPEVVGAFLACASDFCCVNGKARSAEVAAAGRRACTRSA